MLKNLVIALTLTAAALCLPAQAGEWVSLFDGKTLNGWTQLNGEAKYTVEDGTIVGRTVYGSWNSFLCTDKEYGDFELEFEVKVQTGLNSGVQIRSKQKTEKDVDKSKPDSPNNRVGRVFGPQVEIEAGPGQAGYIYAEAHTGWLSEEPKSKDKSVNSHDHFKNDAWNKYRVVAKGPHFETYINGVKIADLTNEEIYKSHPKGFIGLQVHRIAEDKGPYQVAWRNIRIRELD